MKLIFIVCLLLIASLFIGGSFGNKQPNQIIKSTNNITCEMCNFILNYTEQYIAENKTEDQIIQKLEITCDFLPKEWSQTCKETINNYGVLLIRLLINKESPSNICSMVELCTKTTTAAAIYNNKINNNKIETDNLGCSFCKFLTDKLEDYIEANSTQEEIISYLDIECKLLNSPNWILTCQNLVQQYTPIVIELINNNESPSVICQDVKICPDSPSSSSSSLSLSSSSSENVLNKDIIIESNDDNKEFENVNTCQLCNLVTNLIEKYIKSSNEIEEIREMVEIECEHLSKGSACYSLVDQYFEHFLVTMENNYSPNQICQLFEFCPVESTSTSSSTSSSSNEINISQDSGCTVCTVLANYAYRVRMNDSIPAIINNMDQICNKIGGWRDICINLMRSSGEQLVEDIVNNGEGIYAACANIGYCQSSSATGTGGSGNNGYYSGGSSGGGGGGGYSGYYFKNY
ncbi:hypothetical protein ACTA71_000044 [Dictyostelium dimigraforme]